MVHGLRTGVSLVLGLLLGIAFTLWFFPPFELIPPGKCLNTELRSLENERSSEHWEVIISKTAMMPNNIHSQRGKVVRARFINTELGIREKLVVILFGQSSLTVALNASIGRHVPRLQIFVDISRIDGDMASLPNLIPYKPNGQYSHNTILGLIFNMTIHEKYDWYYLIPDTTYVNPFELMRFVNHVNWNRRIAIGSGVVDASKRCSLPAGVLLSNSAMQSLVHERHLCNSISSTSDHMAWEICIHRATNLSCTGYYQTRTYQWWKVDEGLAENGSGAAIHDAVNLWATSDNFNRSLSVSPLLSDADVYALHQHFLRVELDRVDNEIGDLSAEIASLSYDIVDGPSHPAGLPPYSKPPNRHQVPKWQFFTNTEIFKNEPNQNVYALSGDDKLDVDEIVVAARKYVENSGESHETEEFLQLRNGYRLFDPVRGMDYIVDLLYRGSNGVKVHRVHLTRVISNTQLLNQVPYVKEDTDLTIVIPLGSSDEVGAVRRLLTHYARQCQLSAGDNRQTRIIVVVRDVDPSAIRLINNDVIELRIRCKTTKTETMLLLLKSDSHPVLAAAALDEAVDHFGQQMIYLLLSSYADFHPEFLDRVRINTIKHFQVFFPIPFVEYHPHIVSTSEALQTVMKGINVNNQAAREIGEIDREARAAKGFIDGSDMFMSKFRDATFKRNARPLVIHKDQGHFDSNDFSVFSLYGADFIRVRSRLSNKSVLLDLSSLFLGQEDIHVMRAVEPALRLRYHTRVCDPELVDAEYARCLLSRREGLASKAQLANLLFSRKTGDVAIA